MANILKRKCDKFIFEESRKIVPGVEAKIRMIMRKSFFLITNYPTRTRVKRLRKKTMLEQIVIKLTVRTPRLSPPELRSGWRGRL